MTWRLARLPLEAVLTSEAHANFAADSPAPAPREDSFLSALRQRLRSDEELALQLQQGDADALTVLFKRHSPLLFAIARRILRNDTEAEDTVQQIFLDVFRSIHQFDSGKRIVQNLAPDVRLPARLQQPSFSAREPLLRHRAARRPRCRTQLPRSPTAHPRERHPRGPGPQILAAAPAPHHRAHLLRRPYRRGSLQPNRRKRSRRAPQSLSWPRPTPPSLPNPRAQSTNERRVR